MPREIADRITVDPDIMFGKPVVKGTRIPVSVVLGYLAANPDLAELFADYPRLTTEDVQACLSYAKRLVDRQRRARQSATEPVAARAASR